MEKQGLRYMQGAYPHTMTSLRIYDPNYDPNYDDPIGRKSKYTYDTCYNRESDPFRDISFCRWEADLDDAIPLHPFREREGYNSRGKCEI